MEATCRSNANRGVRLPNALRRALHVPHQSARERCHLRRAQQRGQDDKAMLEDLLGGVGLPRVTLGRCLPSARGGSCERRLRRQAAPQATSQHDRKIALGGVLDGSFCSVPCVSWVQGTDALMSTTRSLWVGWQLWLCAPSPQRPAVASASSFMLRSLTRAAACGCRWPVAWGPWARLAHGWRTNILGSKCNLGGAEVEREVRKPPGRLRTSRRGDAGRSAQVLARRAHHLLLARARDGESAVFLR